MDPGSDAEPSQRSVASWHVSREIVKNIRELDYILAISISVERIAGSNNPLFFR
jgi:hypothetical protein